MRANSSSSSARPLSSLRSKASAHLDRHLLCSHLHDRDHVHHLCTAGVVLVINIFMSYGVPSLGLQVLVTVTIFGHDVISDLFF